MMNVMVYEGLSGISDNREDDQRGWCQGFEERLSNSYRCLQQES